MDASSRMEPTPSRLTVFTVMMALDSLSGAKPLSGEIRGDLDFLAGLEFDFSVAVGFLVVLVQLDDDGSGFVPGRPAPFSDLEKAHGNALVPTEARAFAPNVDLVSDTG